MKYLEAGVALVWVFYPRTRSVHDYRANGHSERLTEEHLLMGEEVLPRLLRYGLGVLPARDPGVKRLKFATPRSAAPAA